MNLRRMVIQWYPYRIIAVPQLAKWAERIGRPKPEPKAEKKPKKKKKK